MAVYMCALLFLGLLSMHHSYYATESEASLRVWKLRIRKLFNSTVFSNTKKFDSFTRRLNNQVVLRQKQRLSFLIIGACDGTHDELMTYHYMQDGWDGCFIEPLSINVKDMIMQVKSIPGVSDRTLLIQGAVVKDCPSERIGVMRPSFEELNKSEEHWLRRQLGRIYRPNEQYRNGTFWGKKWIWVNESVACLTPSNVYAQWDHYLKTDRKRYLISTWNF